MSFVLGLVVLALALWALYGFSRADPRTLAIALKTGGGLGALALAGVLGFRGRLDIAIPLGLTGLGLLGWLPWSMPGFGARTKKELRTGFARALGVRGDGARSRHRRHAGTNPRRPARGRAFGSARRADAPRLAARDRRGKPRSTYGVSRPPGARLA